MKNFVRVIMVIIEFIAFLLIFPPMGRYGMNTQNVWPFWFCVFIIIPLSWRLVGKQFDKAEEKKTHEAWVAAHTEEEPEEEYHNTDLDESDYPEALEDGGGFSGEQIKEKPLAQNLTEKSDQEETFDEKLWIAKRTKEYMDEGLLPSEAKIKAETEYILEKARRNSISME